MNPGAIMAGLGSVPLFLSGQANINTGTAISITRPSGSSQGMLLVSAVSSDRAGGVTWTGDTGWTEQVDQGVLPSLRIATKSVAASPPAGDSFTASNSSNLSGIVLAIRKAAFDLIGTIGTLSGTGTLTATGITATGGLLLAAIAVENGLTGSSISSDDGMTALTAQAGTSGYPRMALFSQYVAPGATGNRTFTIGGTGPGASAAVLIGIKRG